MSTKTALATPELTEVLITAFAGDKVALAVDLTPGNATTIVMDPDSTVEASVCQATPIFAGLVTILEELAAVSRRSFPDETITR